MSRQFKTGQKFFIGRAVFSFDKLDFEAMFHQMGSGLPGIKYLLKYTELTEKNNPLILKNKKATLKYWISSGHCPKFVPSQLPQGK